MHPDVDPESRSYRSFRNAVERHWDPGEIDVSDDRVRVARLDRPGLDALRRALALLGAGERSSLADLAPLGVVTGAVDDQSFLAARAYAAARRADFLGIYWEEVVAPEEHARGNDVTSPTDDRWFPDAYVDLFDRVERSTARLLDDDGHENRVRAYCDSLAVEGVFAGAGYAGVEAAFSGELDGVPRLGGLVEGVSKARADGRRHAGFLAAQLNESVESGTASADRAAESFEAAAGLAADALAAAAGDGPLSAAGLDDRADEYRRELLGWIADPEASVPPVDRLLDAERSAD